MASDKNRRIVANYDEAARISPLDILSSGRYASSAFGYAGRLGRFLAAEMELKPTDSLLDVGCNVGVYHGVLAKRVERLVGIDASPRAIERARQKHRRLKNAEYRVGDATSLASADAERFDKILCYSVVHFLADAAELEAMLKSFVALLKNGRGVVFLGEVRETEMYEAFQERRKSGKRSVLRDLKFSLLKAVQGRLMKGGKFEDGIAPTLFRRREIEELAAKLGAKCERIEQDSWHPFYNTCVDYRLRF